MNSCEPFFPEERVDEASANGLLITATAVALLTLMPIAAHQLGMLQHLPDPPSGVFDSDLITGSRSAHPLGIPDSLLGLGSYGVTLALALRARENSAAEKLLGWKLVGDGAVAGFNVVRQVVSFGKLCSWCTGTALCTAAMVFGGRGVIGAAASSGARS